MMTSADKRMMGNWQQSWSLDKIWTSILAIIGLNIFFLASIIANLLLILVIGLHLVSKKSLCHVNQALTLGWWKVAIYLHFVAGIKIKVIGDTLPAGENAILVVNHQSMADIPILAMFADRNGRLADLKWVLKYALKFVPGIGTSLMLLGSPFLKRDWSKDKKTLTQTFQTLRQHPFGFWLVLFPEGTRFTHKKSLKSSKRFEKLNITPFQHLLLPRPKGFENAVGELREQLMAVYELTIVYPSSDPSIWAYSRGEYQKVIMHVKRYPIANLPKEKDQLRAWLLARYIEKDKLIGSLQEDFD